APTTAVRGAVTGKRRLERVYRDNVALVGDASGSVDAITGEGLCLAFQQAVALSEALDAGDLGLYQASHRRIARRPQFMADLLLLLARHPGLRTCALRTMSACPQMFTSMLAMHVRDT